MKANLLCTRRRQGDVIATAYAVAKPKIVSAIVVAHVAAFLRSGNDRILAYLNCCRDFGYRIQIFGQRKLPDVCKEAPIGEISLPGHGINENVGINGVCNVVRDDACIVSRLDDLAVVCPRTSF